MRHLSLFMLSFLLLAKSLSATSGSRTTVNNLSEIDRLYYTCKIWGFMKYYHPLVGKGSFDWDEKLESFLQNTREHTTFDAYSAYVERWIYYMGQLNPCTNCSNAPSENSFLANFDLKWTQNPQFSEALRKRLKDIERNRSQGNHHYVNVGKAGQFEPKNEGGDYSLSLNSPYQRLLPLFRYWNYVEYFFPYKYQASQSWDDVLIEMIPKFLAAETKLDYHLVMLELVVKMDDSQSTFMTSLIDEMPFTTYPPVQLELIENNVVVTKIIDQQKAKANDLRIGDVISIVNGQSALTLHQSHKKYLAGSNDAIKDRTLSYTLFMGLEGSASIEYERGGITSAKNLALYTYTDLEVTKEQKGSPWKVRIDTTWHKITTRMIDTTLWANVDSIQLSDTIWLEETTWQVDTTKTGYADLRRLSSSQIDDAMNQLLHAKTLILDMRGKPKSSYKAIANYLLPTSNVFAKYLLPDFSYPGKFTLKGEGRCGQNKTDSSWYQGHVILLVNEVTQSSSEFACMCFQTAPNVTVVGSQTAGTIGNGSRFNFISRLYATFTGTGVLYPDHQPIQRRGITPDVVVRRSIEGVMEEKDELLERAFEVALADGAE